MDIEVPPKTKLVFFVTEDWYFCSHRLELAIAARERNYEVFVVTRVRNHGQRILDAGLHLIPFEMSRRSANPFSELGVLWRLYQVYRELQPDLVHHVSLKPVLYGSLVARWLGGIRIVNAMAGLGILFSSRSLKARLMRIPIVATFRLLLNGTNMRMILQNPDNVSLMTSLGVVRPECVHLVRGAGVDLDHFASSPQPTGTPKVLLVARMLWDKGVGDFVEAARMLKQRGHNAVFLLAGEPDNANPNAIPVSKLLLWHEAGHISWLGRREDIANLYAECSVACLPSFYGEGIPKSLLEAASVGRPIITTNTPGCREVVENEKNGFLVPARNPYKLAEALERVLADEGLRARMGAYSRELAEREFGLATVVEQTIQIYRDLQAA